MATGFENMVSPYTQLLCPRVDPTDKFDPTFSGFKRKRRIEEPKSVAMNFEGEVGKRINRSMMKHHPETTAQLDHTFVPEKFTGDTKSTRFGRGFNRRSGAVIGVDTIRREAEEAARVRAETIVNHKREKNLADAATGNHSYRGGDNIWFQKPVSQGGGPLDSSCYTNANLSAKQQQRLSLATSNNNASSTSCSMMTMSDARQRSLRVRQTDLFSPLDKCSTAGQIVRQQRLLREGLTVTKKGASVSDSLLSYDGFALPKIAPPGSAPASSIGAASSSTPATSKQSSSVFQGPLL